MRPTTLRSAALTVALLFLAACGFDAEPGDGDAPGSGDAPPPTLRDSAGIAIVENSAPAWGEGAGWQVATEPEAVLTGTGDADFALYQVRGLALLPGGAVAVANAGSNQVAVLERDGRVRATFGGAGEGPGEFQWLNGVLTRSDTVVGVDGSTLRLSLFAPDGSLAREISLDPEQGAPTGIRVAGLGAAGVGIFREVGFAEKMPEPGVVRLPGTGLIVDWSGSRTPPLTGDFRGGAVFVAPDAMGTLPMGADLHLAGSSEGFVVGDGARSEVRIYRVDGSLTRLFRWDHTPPVVDEALRERWKAARMAELRDEMARGAGGDFGGKAGTEEAREELETYYRRQFERTPFPERVPAFAGLLVDDTGHIWVRRYRLREGVTGPASWQGKGGSDAPADGGTGWWVFTRDGRWLGSVTTPAGVQVMAVTEGAVWGVHRDALEVETIRRHALTR